MTTPNVTIDNTDKINGLLTKLAAAQTQADKKSIRRQLRALGHRGGLRVVTPVVPLIPAQHAPTAVVVGPDIEPELETEPEIDLDLDGTELDSKPLSKKPTKKRGKK